MLFDEAHHNFHTAAGRYKPFVDLITNDGYRVDTNRSSIDGDNLNPHDILIVSNALGAEHLEDPKAANPAFTDEECETVGKWVHDGGRLLLIVDHAPMGAAADSLAKRFGVELRNGWTEDPEHCDTAHGGTSTLAFTGRNGLLGDHAIIRGRSDEERLTRLVTFTGQSIQGPEGSVPFLKLSESAYDVLEPGQQKVPAAGRAQGIAFTLGKGRVVVLGEAACLTAQLSGRKRMPFGMNVPGVDNRQLALNIMHWLSGLLD